MDRDEGIAELRRVARERFGWDDLGAEQAEAMRALLDGRDVLVVMPTGSGKSAIYQVPTVVLGGPTVVVSPLIALQRDQVTGLRDSDAPDAVAVNSAQPRSATDEGWQAVEDGDAQYLFLSPSSWPGKTSWSGYGNCAPRCSSSTRPTACPRGATTSVPTTSTLARPPTGWAVRRSSP